MFTEIRSSLRPAITLLAVFTVLLGLGYPLLITGVAQVAMPMQANGSLIRAGDRVIGSELIGQNFAGEGYFHPRLSAAGDGYDASASAASNLAPGSKDLAERIDATVKEYRAQGVTQKLPADIVTTSASGLDLHISPESALIQVNRVAKARGLQPDAVKAIVVKQVEKPLLGFLGEPRVNVLLLNRQIDRESAKQAL
jgi:potassium-transporting ATPase KdpC subunit